jgi:hypothetical protein
VAKLVEEGFVCGKVLSGKRSRNPVNEKIIGSRSLFREPARRETLRRRENWNENMHTRIV